MRILALIAENPDPPIGGPQVRNFHLWDRVRELGHEVRMLALAPSTQQAHTTSRGVRICPMDRYGFARRARLAFTKSHYEWPLSGEMFRAIDELMRTFSPDIMNAEELKMAHFLPAISGRPAWPGLRCQTMTLHNVESDLYAAIGSSASPVLKQLSYRLHMASLRKFERRCLTRLDHVFAYSPDDQARYARLFPGAKLSSTSNGTDTKGVLAKPDQSNPTVLIVGSLSYQPNVEGLRWFFKSVRPLIKANTHVIVAGSRASPEMKGWLRSLPIEFLDTPLDLNECYARSTICLVPLLNGSGTRGRIPEAMSNSRVTITTTKGAEGLGLSEADGVVCRDDPAGFAEAIDVYLTDSQRRRDSAVSARRVAEIRFDWSSVAAQMVATWQSCTSQS